MGLFRLCILTRRALIFKNAFHCLKVCLDIRFPLSFGKLSKIQLCSLPFRCCLSGESSGSWSYCQVIAACPENTSLSSAINGDRAQGTPTLNNDSALCVHQVTGSLSVHHFSCSRSVVFM